MNKLLSLFFMLMVSMATLAADDLFVDQSMPECPLTKVSAEQKLYDEMLATSTAGGSAAAKSSKSVSRDVVRGSVSGMLSFKEMEQRAKSVANWR